MNNKNIAILGILAYILSITINNIGIVGINFLPIIYFLFVISAIWFICMLLFKLWKSPVFFISLIAILFMLTLLVFWEANSYKAQQNESLAYYLGETIMPNVLIGTPPFVGLVTMIMTIAFIFSSIARLREAKRKLLLTLFIGSIIFIIIFDIKFALLSLMVMFFLPIKSGSGSLAMTTMASIGNVLYFIMYFLVVAYLLGFIYKNKKINQ